MVFNRIYSLDEGLTKNENSLGLPGQLSILGPFTRNFEQGNSKISTLSDSAPGAPDFSQLQRCSGRLPRIKIHLIIQGNISNTCKLEFLSLYDSSLWQLERQKPIFGLILCTLLFIIHVVIPMLLQSVIHHFSYQWAVATSGDQKTAVNNQSCLICNASLMSLWGVER